MTIILGWVIWDFVPASFYWNTGNFNFNLYELIIAPTGEYDVSDER